MLFSGHFSQREMRAAFAALEEFKLFEAVSPFFRVGQRQKALHYPPPKVELSAPLYKLQDVNEVQRHVPRPILHIYQGLEAAAMEFAHNVILHPSIEPIVRKEFLHNIRRRSVFRIWRYSPGTGCRPHYDPGLCTALLQASAPGLLLNVQEKSPSLLSPPLNHHYDETGNDGTRGALFSSWEELKTLESDDTAVLNGKMTHIISNGVLSPVLHCVRSDWAKKDEEVRYSFVVELRPNDPRRWYAIHQPE